MKRHVLGLCAALLLISCGTRHADEESGAGTSGRADAHPILTAIAYVMVGADPVVNSDRRQNRMRIGTTACACATLFVGVTGPAGNEEKRRAEAQHVTL